MADFRPLIFGEALFDHFPDGTRVLGGAPFNVAWHLQGFKACPLMVTAVGEDPEGSEIVRRMAAWGMDTSGVQVHPTRPTGRVTATVEGGEPRYEIEAGQAYDFIYTSGLPQEGLERPPDLICHGTLGIRHPTAAEALDYLKDTLATPTLLDVNFRDPWWTRDLVSTHLRGCEWVKVNREEAELIADSPVDTEDRLWAAALAIKDTFQIRNLVVTLGPQGALALDEDGSHRQESPGGIDVVDPVGAGDAFTAVLALGSHAGWPLTITLSRATAFAADLCTLRGATSEDRGLYQEHLEKWSHAT